MPVSRRLFLFAAGSVSPKALACLGASFRFSRDMPGSYPTSDHSEAIPQFLDSTYGVKKWRFDPSFAIKAPVGIAEDPEFVPFRIGSSDPTLVGQFRRLEIFALRTIRVLEAEKFTPDYLPPVYHITETQKNHPKAWRLNEITKRNFRIDKVARYELGSETYPEIDLRQRALGADTLLSFAAFIPHDPTSRIIIAKQTGELKVGQLCKTVIYVAGEWPNGLKTDYDYE